MYYKQIEAKDYLVTILPVGTPITLDEAKEHLKETSNDRDGEIISLINTVTSIAELITGRDMINRTYECYLDCFPMKHGSIKIRRSRLQSITSIQYYSDNVLETVDPADYYFTQSPNFSNINLFQGNIWPDTDKRKQAVIITFVSGYGSDACDIPAALKQGMLSHLAYLYDNAGDCGDDEGKAQFESIYTPYIIPQKLVLVI